MYYMSCTVHVNRSIAWPYVVKRGIRNGMHAWNMEWNIWNDVMKSKNIFLADTC